jgi:hypothetical protein
MYTSTPRLMTSTARILAAVLVVLTSLVAMIALAVGPAGAAPGDDASWAVRTASNSYGADRANFSYPINPGGQQQDGIVVVNHGTTALDLVVYAADGFTTSGGQLDLLTKDAKSVGVGAWVHPDRDIVHVDAGQSVEVPFTISVPDKVAPGDYAGGIITSLKQPDQAAGINVDRRLGIRIRLRIGGELNPGLAVENLKVDYGTSINPFANGDATLSYTIHNTGNAILSARQAATISGPFGSAKVVVAAIPVSPQLLPGETWKVSVHVNGVVAAFRLTAAVTLTPILLDPSGSTFAQPPVVAKSHAWVVPWPVLLCLLLVVALIAVLVRTAQHRRVQRKTDEDARIQDAVEAALSSRT